MIENKLDFRLTEKNGDYGIVFKGSEPVAFAMFNKEDFSLAVAFKNGDGGNYDKTDLVMSVFNITNTPYGLYDYRVTENDAIFNAHYNSYTELNS